MNRNVIGSFARFQPPAGPGSAAFSRPDVERSLPNPTWLGYPPFILA
jgi:hypothetical protein